LANTLAFHDMATLTALDVFSIGPSLFYHRIIEKKISCLTLIPKEGSHGHIQGIDVEEGEDTYGCLLEIIWKNKSKALIKKL